MTRGTWWIVGGTLAAAAVAAGGAARAGPARSDPRASHGLSPANTVLAGTDADPGVSAAPTTGDALARAGSAARVHTGGGRVTETEVGDEEGFYEVEVTRADGSQVDVHLDKGFVVLGSKADEEEGR